MADFLAISTAVAVSFLWMAVANHEIPWCKFWTEGSFWSSAFPSWIQAGAALSTFIVAVLAYRNWRREEVGKTRSEVAKELLEDVHEFVTNLRMTKRPTGSYSLPVGLSAVRRGAHAGRVAASEAAEESARKLTRKVEIAGDTFGEPVATKLGDLLEEGRRITSAVFYLGILLKDFTDDGAAQKDADFQREAVQELQALGFRDRGVAQTAETEDALARAYEAARTSLRHHLTFELRS